MVVGRWWSVPVLAAFASLGLAQPLTEREVDLDGETVRYSIRGSASGAHPQDAAASSRVLNAALAINRLLAAGRLEDAALRSNAPRRRFEVLTDYQRSVGADEFKRVFGEYSDPGNRLVAEVVIGRHSLLVWQLRESKHYAGQYYVEIEGTVYLDDAPGVARARLRRILEGIRSGAIPLPNP